jgi:hypothetical protein
MSSECRGRLAVAVVDSPADGAGWAGAVGTTIGLLTEGELAGPVGGAEDEDSDVAPVHTSTTTKPRAIRTPHDDRQIRPNSTLRSRRSTNGFRSPVSARPPAHGVFPQPERGLGGTVHKT